MRSAPRTLATCPANGSATELRRLLAADRRRSGFAPWPTPASWTHSARARGAARHAAGQDPRPRPLGSHPATVDAAAALHPGDERAGHGRPAARQRQAGDVRRRPFPRPRRTAGAAIAEAARRSPTLPRDAEHVRRLIEEHMFQYLPGVERRRRPPVHAARRAASSSTTSFDCGSADNIGSGLPPDAGDLAELRDRIAGERRAEGAARACGDLAVDGDDLQAELGVRPGPWLGWLLERPARIRSSTIRSGTRANGCSRMPGAGMPPRSPARTLTRRPRPTGSELLLQADRLLNVDQLDAAEALYRRAAEQDPHERHGAWSGWLAARRSEDTCGPPTICAACAGDRSAEQHGTAHGGAAVRGPRGARPARASARRGSCRPLMRILVTGGAGYVGQRHASSASWRRATRHRARQPGRPGHRANAGDSRRAGERQLRRPRPRRGPAAGAPDRGRAPLRAHARWSASRSPIRRSTTTRTWSAASALLDAMRDAGVDRLVFSSTRRGLRRAGGDPDPRGRPDTTDEPVRRDEAGHSSAPCAGTRSTACGRVSLRYFNVAGASERHGERHDPRRTSSRTSWRRPEAGTPVTLFGTDYPTPDGTQHPRLHPRR